MEDPFGDVDQVARRVNSRVAPVIAACRLDGVTRLQAG